MISSLTYNWRHMYKGVSHALVLVDTNKNVLCAGHNAIVKKISAKKLP